MLEVSVRPQPVAKKKNSWGKKKKKEKSHEGSGENLQFCLLFLIGKNSLNLSSQGRQVTCTRIRVPLPKVLHSHFQSLAWFFGFIFGLILDLFFRWIFLNPKDSSSTGGVLVWESVGKNQWNHAFELIYWEKSSLHDIYQRDDAKIPTISSYFFLMGPP